MVEHSISLLPIKNDLFILFFFFFIFQKLDESIMDKRNKIILTTTVIVCSALIVSISLVYFLAEPRSTCCSHLTYTSYSQPNNSTNHFSINVINYGAVDSVIRNITAFRFTNSSDTYYSIKAFGNGTEISFPFAIEQENEVNITLELNWHFTVGSQYIFTLEYDYGKSFDLIFIANKSL